MTLIEGQRVLISEAALRRIFAGWSVPYALWHPARAVDCGDMVAIPQHGVNVSTGFLQERDVLILDDEQQAKLAA